MMISSKPTFYAVTEVESENKSTWEGENENETLYAELMMESLILTKLHVHLFRVVTYKSNTSIYLKSTPLTLV
ncbi:hypothetical protein M408DRAFT_298237 [Serendipita vermifera MAFF 305830]|uniref:Uncharacterized protein n=1 Tax=Serendipita vermifera MAFF 305830 TaxID=933852 RepID=A0A0C3ABK5_SERVB|nr:hypothetical protein M408DRAFT_298237 [Serendipita vermifera MAFF 305830]